MEISFTYFFPFKSSIGVGDAVIFTFMLAQNKTCPVCLFSSFPFVGKAKYVSQRESKTDSSEKIVSSKSRQTCALQNAATLTTDEEFSNVFQHSLFQHYQHDPFQHYPSRPVLAGTRAGVTRAELICAAVARAAVIRVAVTKHWELVQG